MNALAKIILNSVTGIILGAATLFIAVVTVVGFAFATHTTAFIPGVFHAWFTSENDLPALSFEPNGIGMLLFILIVAIIYVVSAAQIGKKLAERRKARA